MPKFELDGISFDVLPPNEVEDEEYAALREIEEAAFRHAVPDLGQAEVDYYLHDLEDYTATRRDPQLLIEEGRLNPNQQYDRPYIAIAYADEAPIGYAHGANNVSGKSAEIRKAKSLISSKNYHWLRIIAVEPEFQGRGIAHKLAQLFLEKAGPGQPATAYTWPELVPRMSELLERWDFEPTNADDPQVVYPFGEAEVSRAVRQVRYASKSARMSARRIAELIAA